MATKAPAKKTTPATKSTVKTAPKKVAPKKPAAKVSAPAKTVEKTQSVQPKAPLKVKKSYVVLVLAILVVGAALYFLRSFFVAAVVNGQPISRLEVVSQTEKQAGKQALSTLVRNSLIEQEAKKNNVSISDKEVSEEIKKLEGTLSKQGQKLDQVLQVQGMTREDLNKLIKLDKLVAKMVGKDVTVTDKEVDEYVEKNKDLLPKDQDPKTFRQGVAEQLKQQKTNEKVKTWLEDLQNKSKVIYFVQY